MRIPERARRGRGMLLLAILAMLAIIVPATALATPRTPVNLQFLNYSDWHGQLDPIGGAGGAAVLSAYFQADRAANPNTLTLTGGDDFGATPPLSNFFDEEPAVIAQRMMGLNVGGLGNHNFDRGVAHLQQMVDLAGAPAGAQPGNPYTYVSANLANRDDNLSGVKDFEIFDVGGVKVAVIGITNPEAPTLVFPGSFGTIVPTDPIPAANMARAAAKRAGAQVFVAVTHLGITGFDGTGAATGPLVDFANNVGGFNLIFGDHTNFQYSGIHNNALVVENLSRGATYARVHLAVDPRNGRTAGRSVEFVAPTAALVTPDPAIVGYLAPLRSQLSTILGTVIGSSTVFIPRSDACGRSDGRLCESLVGNAVTDSMRLRYGTDFAITNAGGLRANLTCPTTDLPLDLCPPYSPPPFPITSGQVLTVLPFGNAVVTVNLTGSQLKAFLENGVSAMPGANGRFAQVSGLCFTYDVSAPAGSRVTSAVWQAPDGTCTSTPVDLTAASSYSVATNDFVANGGDGYPNVIGSAVTRDLMDQVLAAYVTANTPITPVIQGRINCTSSGATVCPTILP